MCVYGLDKSITLKERVSSSPPLYPTGKGTESRGDRTVGDLSDQGRWKHR